MITKRKVTIWISLAAAMFAGLAVMEVRRGPRSFLAGFDRGMHARYEGIPEGVGDGPRIARIHQAAGSQQSAFCKQCA
jgi:hypothetical protein